MNKSIVSTLIIGTMVVSSLLAACGQASPPEVVQRAEAAEAEAGIGALVAIGAAAAPMNVLSDEDRLDAMQYSLQMLVADSLNHGQVVSEDVFDTTQAIEQAKEALRQLDGQMAGLQMLVALHGAMGASPLEGVFDSIEAVERSRQEILKGIGLNP